MDFIELYDSLESAYEIGLGIEIKEYLNSSEYVKEFSLKLVKDELIIHIKCENLYMHRLVYGLIEFVSYDYLCMLHKVESDDYYIYYVYTKMNSKCVGMKIQLNLLKQNN